MKKNLVKTKVVQQQEQPSISTSKSEYKQTLITAERDQARDYVHQLLRETEEKLESKSQQHLQQLGHPRKVVRQKSKKSKPQSPQDWIESLQLSDLTLIERFLSKLDNDPGTSNLTQSLDHIMATIWSLAEEREDQAEDDPITPEMKHLLQDHVVSKNQDSGEMEVDMCGFFEALGLTRKSITKNVDVVLGKKSLSLLDQELDETMSRSSEMEALEEMSRSSEMQEIEESPKKPTRQSKSDSVYSDNLLTAKDKQPVQVPTESRHRDETQVLDLQTELKLLHDELESSKVNASATNAPKPQASRPEHQHLLKQLEMLTSENQILVKELESLGVVGGKQGLDELKEQIFGKIRDSIPDPASLDPTTPRVGTQQKNPNIKTHNSITAYHERKLQWASIEMGKDGLQVFAQACQSLDRRAPAQFLTSENLQRAFGQVSLEFSPREIRHFTSGMTQQQFHLGKKSPRETTLVIHYPELLQVIQAMITKNEEELEIQKRPRRPTFEALDVEKVLMKVRKQVFKKLNGRSPKEQLRTPFHHRDPDAKGVIPTSSFGTCVDEIRLELSVGEMEALERRYQHPKDPHSLMYPDFLREVLAKKKNVSTQSSLTCTEQELIALQKLLHRAAVTRSHFLNRKTFQEIVKTVLGKTNKHMDWLRLVSDLRSNDKGEVCYVEFLGTLNVQDRLSSASSDDDSSSSSDNSHRKSFRKSRSKSQSKSGSKSKKQSTPARRHRFSSSSSSGSSSSGYASSSSNDFRKSKKTLSKSKQKRKASSSSLISSSSSLSSSSSEETLQTPKLSQRSLEKVQKLKTKFPELSPRHWTRVFTRVDTSQQGLVRVQDWHKLILGLRSTCDTQDLPHPFLSKSELRTWTEVFLTQSKEFVNWKAMIRVLTEDNRDKPKTLHKRDKPKNTPRSKDKRDKPKTPRSQDKRDKPELIREWKQVFRESRSVFQRVFRRCDDTIDQVEFRNLVNAHIKKEKDTDRTRVSSSLYRQLFQAIRLKHQQNRDSESESSESEEDTVSLPRVETLLFSSPVGKPQRPKDVEKDRFTSSALRLLDQGGWSKLEQKFERSDRHQAGHVPMSVAQKVLRDIINETHWPMFLQELSLTPSRTNNNTNQFPYPKVFQVLKQFDKVKQVWQRWSQDQRVRQEQFVRLCRKADKDQRGKLSRFSWHDILKTLSDQTSSESLVASLARISRLPYMEWIDTLYGNTEEDEEEHSSSHCSSSSSEEEATKNVQLERNIKKLRQAFSRKEAVEKLLRQVSSSRKLDVKTFGRVFSRVFQQVNIREADIPLIFATIAGRKKEKHILIQNVVDFIRPPQTKSNLSKSKNIRTKPSASQSSFPSKRYH